LSTFTIPLTREQFDKAAARLAEKNIHIDRDFGVLDHSGVGVAFKFNGKDSLEITIDHKPWLYPENKVESAIRDWFKETA